MDYKTRKRKEEEEHLIEVMNANAASGPFDNAQVFSARSTSANPLRTAQSEVD